jgi:hypothetical protein
MSTPQNEQQERLLEIETDKMADGLHDKVSRIKQITRQMQEQLTGQHTM